ncbi:MAG: hypothetical protein JOZ57_03665 [Abitibacteriaceae bacterium]|nr:hypothetical protein [Abditibacteriaceae bacterium]
MEPISLQAAKAVDLYRPDFAQSVRDLVENRGALMIMFDNFEGQPELLYNCLWYAASHGVLVSVAPRVMRSFLPILEESST